MRMTDNDMTKARTYTEAEITAAILSVRELHFRQNPGPLSDRDGPLDREHLAGEVIKMLKETT